MSKTLHMTGHGGYDKMSVVETPRPSPGKGEVLVNIKANGLNFAELACRLGLYDQTPKLPAVLGLEGAGVVVDLGEDVEKETSLQVGDRVICWSDFGLWSEYVSVAIDHCNVMPDDMTFEEGAAITVSYITAYHMLFDIVNLRKGNSVLIHIAGGGVGVAATQLCRTVPDVTIFGTSSASKHDVIRANGVDYPIDYRTEDYVKAIRNTSPAGVDIVLDPLSGADAVKGFELLKPLGKIVHFGFANFVTGPKKNLWQIAKTYMATKSYSGMGLMGKNKTVCGYHLGHLTDDVDLINGTTVELVTMYNDGKIKPIIDSVWAYEDIAKAMARMHDRLNTGKVIISPQKAPTTE